jgi:hypothetical protein
MNQHRQTVEDIFLHVKCEVENEKKPFKPWLPFSIDENEKHFTGR